MSETQTPAPPRQQPATPPADHKHTAEPPSRGFFREHPIKAIIGLIVVAGILIGGYMFWQYSQTYENTDDAFIEGHTDYISPRIAGTITKVNVVENQFVKAGDVLAEIDPADYQVSYERAVADVAQAQAQIKSLTPNVPITATTNQSSITSTQADLSNAEAGVAAAERDYQAALGRLKEAQANNGKAKSDLARYKMLVAKDEVSQQDYDARAAAVEASDALVQSLQQTADASAKIIDQKRAALAAVQVRLQQIQTNAPKELEIRRAAVKSAEATAQAAKAQVDQAQLNLQYTKIIAPISGLIGHKLLEPGMRVQPGQQMLAIVPLDDIWVTANFKENQIQRMHPGQKVVIHVDAFDKDYNGYIESLPAATSATFSLLPPENATGNYVKVVQRLPVRIRFNAGEDPDHRLRPGMSVEPKVFL